MGRFQVSEENRRTQNYLEGTFVVLKDTEENSQAEIWPALGFNCVRWFTTHQKRQVEWLFASPQLLEETRPTRSGIPILFPFPNRIRDGRFTWDGKQYRLSLNDPTQKNAIHGFACRYPWRVVDSGGDGESAWVTGEFWASRDALELLSLWPADHRIQVTYRLRPGQLDVEALVENPDQIPLPFGLGYHPYLRLPAAPEQTLVEAPLEQYWELEELLPTGERKPVTAHMDLRKARPYSELQLDDVLTDLQTAGYAGKSGMNWRGTIRDAQKGHRLDLFASPVFRELVVFTPPHRQAICMEPYTCTTDAINLQQQGGDAGWQVLPPGQRWSATFSLMASKKKEMKAKE